MVLFQVTLLSSILFTSLNSNPVLEIYEPFAHKCIYFENNQYIEESYNGIEESDDTYSTIRSCLRLPIDFRVEHIIRPNDIKGVSEDIPYNYHATINQSAKVLYSMIYQGWEIEYYISKPDKIEVELIREDESCRVVILEDLLKVYQKSEL